MKARGPMRRVKRGSSMGKARPLKVISQARPSPSFTVTFRVCSGSMTVMEMGPT